MNQTDRSWVTPFLVLSLFVSLFSAYTFVNINNLKAQNKTNGANNVDANPNQNNPQPAEPTPNLDALPPVTSDDHIRGNKNADVLLVEYSDFECPFCKSFHPTIQRLTKEYGNKVAWVYRHYPLPFHANAQMEAEASECVADIGGKDKFWQYADTVYEKTQSTGTSFTKEQIATIAADIGVNKDKFNQCLASGKFTKKVTEQMSGGSSAGINGTPGTIVVGKNGKKELIPGALPYEQAKAIIDRVLSG